MAISTGEQSIDRNALRRKYAIERQKRLRADGANQYKRLESEFSNLAEDPYTPRLERTVFDHVTFAFWWRICWFSHRQGLRKPVLMMLGLSIKAATLAVLGIEPLSGSSVRYGLNDLHVIARRNWIYAQRKYAYRNKRSLLQDRHYRLYEKALFHTRVTCLEWKEREVLHINDRGDAFTAKYVGMGTGPLHVAKLPGLTGIEKFKGKSFHTSRWDYSYTGGSPDGKLLDKLADKKVAIIGTGATAVQCVPHLARSAKQLFVFQRTPSSVDERNNAQIDPNWFAEINEPGWQKKWQENFVANLGIGFPAEDLVEDGWTDLGKRIRALQ